jgi:hypothetical protein
LWAKALQTTFKRRTTGQGRKAKFDANRSSCTESALIWRERVDKCKYKVEHEAITRTEALNMTQLAEVVAQQTIKF